MIADIGGRRFEWGSRTYVMGIINVTPDSFSGYGIGGDEERAVSQGLRMVNEVADMLDVGGESTRPGHQPITAAEEIGRTESVVARLARETEIPISIDTYKLALHHPIRTPQKGALGEPRKNYKALVYLWLSRPPN